MHVLARELVRDIRVQRCRSARQARRPLWKAARVNNGLRPALALQRAQFQPRGP